MGSTFGTLFRVTTFGESHGPAVGVVIDGCPAQVPLAVADIQRQLDRRRPGQSRLTTQRREADAVRIVSGIIGDDAGGVTLGTPIALLVDNADVRSRDYDDMARIYRPSHADYTYQAKFGVRAASGGGRASARETVARVAAGAVAQAVLDRLAAPGQVTIVAWVAQVADIVAEVEPGVVAVEDVEATPVRCPDGAAAARMIERIEAARKDGDSVGGVIAAVARGVPPGLGAPVFDKLEADLAKAMLSLPAAKGFDIGSGFAGALMTGSAHNDAFVTDAAGRVRTRTNRSGGVQGGISNGEDILFRVAFKPTATIMRPQETIDEDGRAVTLTARGRHDPCVLPRAVPIVEAMCALVLCDHWLRHRGQRLADR